MGVLGLTLDTEVERRRRRGRRLEARAWGPGAGHWLSLCLQVLDFTRFNDTEL